MRPQEALVQGELGKKEAIFWGRQVYEEPRLSTSDLSWAEQLVRGPGKNQLSQCKSEAPWEGR